MISNYRVGLKVFFRSAVLSAVYFLRTGSTGALQVNTLLYAMGGEYEDIFTSFTFDDGADQNNYGRVKEKFDHHFIKMSSTIGRNSTNAYKVKTN